MATFSDLIKASYTSDAIKVASFLSLAESFGCKLLSSNTNKLKSTLHELKRVMQRDVYPVMEKSSRTAEFVAIGKRFDEAIDRALTDLLPKMKDEETLGLNWDEVQMTLEAHLPSVLAHLRSLQDKQLPALEAALKTPEAAEKLLQAIQASQALFIKEEEDRVAAEAAALLKTRAGKKMQQLENEKRRAEAKRLAEANGGKKNKGMIAEEDDETAEKKKALEAKRAARAKAAAERKVATAMSTPATVVGEATQHVELLSL